MRSDTLNVGLMKTGTSEVKCCL